MKFDVTSIGFNFFEEHSMDDRWLLNSKIKSRKSFSMLLYFLEKESERKLKSFHKQKEIKFALGDTLLFLEYLYLKENISKRMSMHSGLEKVKYTRSRLSAIKRGQVGMKVCFTTRLPHEL